MNKPTLFFLIPLIFFAGAALLALMFVRASRQQITTTPSPTSIQPTILPIPTSKTIESHGVTINNPFTNAKAYTVQGDALSVKTEAYEIVYLKNFDEFIITILNEPFEANRKIAEEDLLKRLGITQSQACSLKVSVSPPAKQDELSPRYGLSFCSN